MSERWKIVGLGEILWDCFPDQDYLGGAPLNFACSVSQLARNSADVSIVSAVGDDHYATRAFDSIRHHAVDSTCIQTHSHPTGKVFVELDRQGVASYRFAEDAAWDHLVWNDCLNDLSSQCDAVCFGTLGQRSPTSSKTIRRFLEQTSSKCLRILDVNLRQPFVQLPIIHASLELANVLKLNDEELPQLANMFQMIGSEIELLRQLAEKFQLQCVALTRGARGAFLLSDHSESHVDGESVEVADTVGAGDAFTAAMTLGLLGGCDLDSINRYATQVAAYTCSQSGATMSFPEHLEWKRSHLISRH